MPRRGSRSGRCSSGSTRRGRGVFFGEDLFGAAVAVIVALDVAVIATVAVFARRDRLAAALLLPYLAWIVYATALNVAIWQLN